ncbi:hypothetical protein ACFYRJ_36575 [Streptomyces sp. NPDC005531]|uniref:hypothetical protein n=1 Tax=Streptomyces sp. NPDC005531 TaxID=3364722 RepID=UPI00367456C8
MLLGRKRRSRPGIDETEDGGRAIAIEEGISALVFSYGSCHHYDRPLRSQRAARRRLGGSHHDRLLRLATATKHGGGCLELDFDAERLTFVEP